VAPDAVEGMGYGMPAYKHRGRPLIYFGAAKHHCALYGIPAAIAEHERELARFDIDKGTIRFPFGAPPSQRLIARLLRSRMAEIEASEVARKGRKRPAARA